MLVATSVATDTRVLREAVTLAGAGHEVHVIGKDVPDGYAPARRGDGVHRRGDVILPTGGSAVPLRPPAAPACPRRPVGAAAPPPEPGVRLLGARGGRGRRDQGLRRRPRPRLHGAGRRRGARARSGRALRLRHARALARPAAPVPPDTGAGPPRTGGGAPARRGRRRRDHGGGGRRGRAAPGLRLAARAGGAQLLPADRTRRRRRPRSYRPGWCTPVASTPTGSSRRSCVRRPA